MSSKILLELFAGTRSISKAFEKHGWTTYSVEWDKKFENITLYADISELTADQVIYICGGRPTVIWASPDCTTYSIVGLHNHRKKILGKITPISDYAKFCDKTNKHLLELIEELKPDYFFIENPRGALRKMPFMLDLEKRGLMKRYTVTYCQYGDFRQKPTDIWTNYPEPGFKKPCNAGDKCHQATPRGHPELGTRSLKDRALRATIPPLLCDYIATICDQQPIVKQRSITDYFRAAVLDKNLRGYR